MPRKPNYRFDRMERDRAKALKRTERLKSKEDKTGTRPDQEPAEQDGQPTPETESETQTDSETQTGSEPDKA